MQLTPKLIQLVRGFTIRGSRCSAVPACAASPRQAVYLCLSLMLWIAFAASYSASGAVIHTATFNGHTYYLLDTDGTKWWQEAEAEAVLLGGHLVTINTAEENQWVFETFAPVTIDYANTHDLPDQECISLWIGLSDAATEGTWMWVSGEPVTYTNWGPGQPDEVPDQNFAGMYVPNFGTPSTWHDLIGDTSFCDLPFGVVEVDDDNDVVPVEIDIKPGSSPNRINPKSNGTIQVAILTTDAFDATTVDPVTVRFGPEGAAVHSKGHIRDVNRDGEPDLVLHFKTRETGIQCGDTSASLTGETVDGNPIQGSDAITTVGCKP